MHIGGVDDWLQKLQERIEQASTETDKRQLAGRIRQELIATEPDFHGTLFAAMQAHTTSGVDELTMEDMKRRLRFINETGFAAKEHLRYRRAVLEQLALLEGAVPDASSAWVDSIGCDAYERKPATGAQ